MTVSPKLSRQEFVDDVVREGRYSSADAVIAEGLRLLQHREAMRNELRAKLEAAIAEGGEVSDEEMDHALAARAAELRRSGIPD